MYGWKGTHINRQTASEAIVKLAWLFRPFGHRCAAPSTNPRFNVADKYCRTRSERHCACVFVGSVSTVFGPSVVMDARHDGAD